MIWWIAGAAFVGVVKLVMESFSEDERHARHQWEQTYHEVQRSTAEHRQHIAQHLDSAQQSWDFYVLTDMHFSSMIVANSAWQALANARISQNAIDKGIQKTRREIGQLQQKINRETDYQTRGDLINEIKLIRQLLEEFIVEIKTLRIQTRKLYEEVTGLNHQTRALKLAIRDRCGSRGWMWFEQREAHRFRRKSESV